MKLITLFEHQPLSFAEIQLSANHRVWEALDALNTTAGRELIRLERKGIRATEFVGVIQFGDITIQILPKIDNDGSSNARFESIPYNKAKTSAVRNLLFMLSYAYNLHLSAQDLAGLDANCMSWFEILTRLFAGDLHQQIQSGMAHNYIPIEDTLPVIRGRWDINRQLLLRPLQHHTFDVTYDEFSPDIALNQAFRWTIEHLLMRTQDDLNTTLLEDLRDWFNGVTLVGENPRALIPQIHFSRLNDRFEPAFNLASLFMSGDSIQLTGGHHQVFAFVLDMNVLFEQFLTHFLIRHHKAIFPDEWNTVQIRPQAEGTHFYLAETLPEGTPVIRLKPDILFMRPGFTRPLIIADAKYKILDPTRTKLTPTDSDIYQMLAYSMRLECPTVLLLYPQSSSPVHQTLHYSITHTLLEIRTINLHRSLETPSFLIEELRAIFQSVIIPSMEVFHGSSS